MQRFLVLTAILVKESLVIQQQHSVQLWLCSVLDGEFF